MALVEGLQLDVPHVPRLASALAGGLGGTHRWTCGVLNAAAVVAGLVAGRDEVTPDPAPGYYLAGRLIVDFEERFGTVLCHELVGIAPELPDVEFRAECKRTETRTRVCDGLKDFTIRRFIELLPSYSSQS